MSFRMPALLSRDCNVFNPDGKIEYHQQSLSFGIRSGSAGRIHGNLIGKFAPRNGNFTEYTEDLDERDGVGQHQCRHHRLWRRAAADRRDRPRQKLRGRARWQGREPGRGRGASWSEGRVRRPGRQGRLRQACLGPPRRIWRVDEAHDEGRDSPDRHRHHRGRCAGAKRHHRGPRSQYAHRRGAAPTRPPSARACQSPDAASSKSRSRPVLPPRARRGSEA